MLGIFSQLHWFRGEPLWEKINDLGLLLASRLFELRSFLNGFQSSHTFWMFCCCEIGVSEGNSIADSNHLYGFVSNISSYIH